MSYFCEMCQRHHGRGYRNYDAHSRWDRSRKMAPIPKSEDPSWYEEAKAELPAIATKPPEVPRAVLPPRTFDGPTVKLDLSVRHPRVEKLDEFITSKLIGQEEGRDAVVRSYEKVVAGMTDHTHPLATLLFLGPTGTGKTRIAELLNEFLHGSNGSMLKVDCGEYQHSHEIARLAGSPPGYLGHRETQPYFNSGVTAQVSKDGEAVTVLLFDEVEKASDSLFKLLLGILDKATMSTGDNKKVDFSRCFVILTSNLGAEEIVELLREKEDALARMKQVAIEAARKKFAPEFFNRLDEVVVFHPLTRKQLSSVVGIELSAIEKRMENQDIRMKLSDRVVMNLLDEGTDSRYGARQLKRVMERKIVTPVARLLSCKQLITGDRVHVDSEVEGFTFSKVKGAVV